jgi:hypothetical protein
MISLFSKNKPPILIGGFRILFFFRVPRTVAIVLGEISNLHHFFQETMICRQSLPVAYKKLFKVAWRHYNQGIEKDGYFKSKVSKLLPRWASFDATKNKEKFVKRERPLLDDKRSGGNTGVYLECPEKTKQYIEEHQSCLLQIVRHHEDAALSAEKVFDQTFEEALEDQVHRGMEACAVLKVYPEFGPVLYHEGLLISSEQVSKEMLTFLDVETGEEWLYDVLKSVNNFKPKTYTAKQLEQTKSYIEKHKAEELYRRYEDL